MCWSEGYFLTKKQTLLLMSRVKTKKQDGQLATIFDPYNVVLSICQVMIFFLRTHKGTSYMCIYSFITTNN